MASTGQMTARSENCTGCLMCQLACSFTKTSEFSPSKSFVSIERIDKSERYEVGFTEDCDGCGVCTQYCYYDAIEGE